MEEEIRYWLDRPLKPVVVNKRINSDEAKN